MTSEHSIQRILFLVVKYCHRQMLQLVTSLKDNAEGEGGKKIKWFRIKKESGFEFIQKMGAALGLSVCNVTKKIFHILSQSMETVLGDRSQILRTT